MVHHRDIERLPVPEVAEFDHAGDEGVCARVGGVPRVGMATRHMRIMMPGVTDVDETVAGFAALMAGARTEAGPKADPEAPYGYTVDKDGTQRPKKAPGRPRKAPSLEDLKAAKEADPAPGAEQPTGDRPPVTPKGRRGQRRLHAVKGEPKPLPPVPQKYRAEGSIAKGVNQLDRQAGKLIRAFDRDIGQALIDITRAEDPEDITVGDAWEAYARTHPRVRAFLIRVLSGSASAELFRAHLPVLAAVVMKEAIRERIPLGRLFMAFADDDEQNGTDGAEADSSGQGFSGLSEADIEGAMAFAQSMMERAQGDGTGRVPGGD